MTMAGPSIARGTYRSAAPQVTRNGEKIKRILTSYALNQFYPRRSFRFSYPISVYDTPIQCLRND